MSPLTGLGMKFALAGVAAVALGTGLVYTGLKLDDDDGGPLRRAVAWADNSRQRQLFDQEVTFYQTILDFIERHGEGHAAVRAAGITSAQVRARQEEAALDHVAQELTRARISHGELKKSTLRSALERLAAMRQCLPQSARLASYDVESIHQLLAAAEKEIADSSRANIAAATTAADRANTTTPRAWTNIADYRRLISHAARDMRALDAGSATRRELGVQIGDLARRLETDPAYENFRLRAGEDERNTRLTRQFERARTEFDTAQRELHSRRRTFHNTVETFLGRNPTARIPRPPAAEAGDEPLTSTANEVSSALGRAHSAARAYLQAARDIVQFDPTSAEILTRTQTVATTLAANDYRRGFDRFATALADWRSSQLTPPPSDLDRRLRSPSERLHAARDQLRAWEADLDSPTPPGAAPEPAQTPAPAPTPAAAPGRQAVLSPALLDSEDLRRADG